MSASPAGDTNAELLRLEPVSGPDTAAIVVSTDGPLVVGRAQECDVCLPHPSMSRRHLTLMRRGDDWFVTDLGSRHGTSLSGLALEPKVATPAAPGNLLRIGPYTFRFHYGDSTTPSIVTRDAALAPGTIVERASRDELESLAAKRVDLIMDSAIRFHEATTSEELARTVVNVALAGSGFKRAIMLANTGSTEESEVLAAHDTQGRSDIFAFSKSLVAEASAGHVVRLSAAEVMQVAHSIGQLGIHSAVCAPLVLDSSVVAFLYLDSRELEEPAFPDAVAFVHAIARLASLSLANIRRTEVVQRQERIESDLRAARLGQKFLGPPQEGEIGPLKYASRTTPGRFVAGDLFDVFTLPDDRVVVCMGDVSGQGVGAGLLTTAILSHLNASLMRVGSIAKAVGDLNRYIAARTAENMFVSLVAGIFEPDGSRFTFVDAGHGHWLVRRAGAAPIAPPDPGGLIVGVDPNYAYEEVSIDLAPEDRLIFYSDGVVEHRGADGSEWGRDRLITAIEGAASPDDDVALALDGLAAFIGDLGLSDDTTIASVRIGAAPA